MNCPLIIHWSAHTFLWFYGLLLAAPTIFTLWLRAHVNRNFTNNRGSSGPLSDEQIAYLSGGPHRCSQALLFRLIIENKVRFSAGGRKWDSVFTKNQSTNGLAPAQAEVLQVVIDAGDKGIKAKDFYAECAPVIHQVEESLAQKGLHLVTNSTQPCVIF